MNDKQRFGEILIRAGVLNRERLDKALEAIGDEPVDLGETLVSSYGVDEKLMLKTISKALNLPSISLAKATPDSRAIQLVPMQMCVDHCLIPIEVERGRGGEHLHLAMANPSDVRAIKKITRQTRLRIRPMVASAREIRDCIGRHYEAAEPPPSLAASMEQAVAASPTPVPMELTPAPVEPALGRSATPPPAGVEDSLFDFGVTDLSRFDTEGGPALGSAAFPKGNLRRSRITPPPPPRTANPVGLAPLGTPPPMATPAPARGEGQKREGAGVYVKVSRRRTGPRRAVSEQALAGASAPEPSSASALPPMPPGLASSASSPSNQSPVSGLKPASGSGISAAGIARSRKTINPLAESAGLPPLKRSKSNGPSGASSAPARPKSGEQSGVINAARTRRRRTGSQRSQSKEFLKPLPTPAGLRESEPRTAQRARLSGPLPRATGPMPKLDGSAERPNADTVMLRYLERFERSGEVVDAQAFFTDMERMLADSDSLTTRLVIALCRQLGQAGAVDLQALLLEARGR